MRSITSTFVYKLTQFVYNKKPCCSLCCCQKKKRKKVAQKVYAFRFFFINSQQEIKNNMRCKYQIKLNEIKERRKENIN